MRAPGSRPFRFAPAVTALAVAALLCGAAARAPQSRAPQLRAPEPLDRVAADVPQAALDAHLAGDVTVRARVDLHGLVDSVSAVAGDPLLRASALEAVRWWIWAAPKRPFWTTVTVAIDGRADVDPITPDVLELARDAESRNAWAEALDPLAGALQRIGTHPTLRNEWALRARLVADAKHLAAPPAVPGALMASCMAARGEQPRTLASDAHASFAATFGEALQAAPWDADLYQWRAASFAVCGRGLDAMRDLVMLRAAARDAAARALAGRAIAQLAAGDTLGTAQLLVREGVHFNTEEVEPPHR